MADAPEPQITPEGLQSIENMLQGARRMEVKLGLPEGFCWGLINEADDWGFVLKLHSVVDTALESLILDKCFPKPPNFNAPRGEAIQRICNALPFNGRVSKMAFVKAFQLLDADTLSFCETLAIIRNRYAHRLSNVRLTIADVLAEAPDGPTLRGRLVPPLPDTLEDTPAILRFLIAIRAMIALWAIEFRSKPLPTFLSGLLIGGGNDQEKGA